MNQIALKAGYVPLSQVTEGQPFPAGTGGCDMFRIPGLITLDNGYLFATSDARWNDADSDYGGIDTIYALSEDNGETWRHGYAVYFPDSLGTPPNPENVTTCIDSTPMQTPDGAIHIFVNINPSGITTALNWPGSGTGFFTVGGRKRLAVTDSFEKSGFNPCKHPEYYPYYIGDFENGFAPIESVNGEKTVYIIDEFFNIYKSAENGPEHLWQKQEESEENIVQNLFYRRSAFHVFSTMYTFHLVSTDIAKTWHGSIISDQIKSEDESGLIAAPGSGLVTKDGLCVLPFYTLEENRPFENSKSRLAFSYDKGKTWQITAPLNVSKEIPWSGESKPVLLPKGNIRLFFRTDTKRICYADYDMKSQKWLEPVKTDIVIHSDCNFGAINCGSRILLTCPCGINEDAADRFNGKLFCFDLDKNCNLILKDKVAIDENIFSYSVLTETADGKIGVLYDTCEEGYVYFKKIDIKNIRNSLKG
ncbi:MAG: glycoside hydrolase [Clostridiales bacterium]|nr:glycoside hydrolase [Clostridiales bacterium]